MSLRSRFLTGLVDEDRNPRQEISGHSPYPKDLTRVSGGCGRKKKRYRCDEQKTHSGYQASDRELQKLEEEVKAEVADLSPW
jgi:hypothetical protein